MIGLTEKPFDMDFGSQVMSLMFDMMDEGTLSIMDSVLRSAIANEPRVELKDLDIQPNPELNEIKIQIVYTIVGYEETYTYSHILTPTR